MLRPNEIMTRLKLNDGRIWFVNVETGELVDAMDVQLATLRQHPKTWFEMPIDGVKATAGMKNEDRVIAVREYIKRTSVTECPTASQVQAPAAAEPATTEKSEKPATKPK